MYTYINEQVQRRNSVTEKGNVLADPSATSLKPTETSCIALITFEANQIVH